MTSLARMFSEMDYIYANNSEIATKLLSIGVRWLMVDLEFVEKTIGRLVEIQLFQITRLWISEQ